MAKHNRDYKPEDILFPDQAITQSNLVEEMENGGGGRGQGACGGRR